MTAPVFILSTLPSLGPPFPLGGLFFAPAFHAGAMSAVPGGVVTTVVGADVWIGKSAFRVINPQMSATIGVAKQALRHGFVEVDARNVSFCRVSRHGQNCSRRHRENAEQGVAGLAHSPLHSIPHGSRISTTPLWPRGECRMHRTQF